MASNVDIVTTLLTENSTEDFLSAAGVLITFADNILKNPYDPKYRKIRITNPTVQSKLLSCVGGMECLFTMGFEEDGEHLTLPTDTNLGTLRIIRDTLAQESSKQREQTHELQQATNRDAPQALGLPVELSRVSSVQTVSEAEFAGRIRSGMIRVQQYEKPHVQQKAKATIPLRDLQVEAEANLKAAQSKGYTKRDLRDFLLLSLLKWFKSSFFKWVDTLPCSQCRGATRHNGSVQPEEEDLRWGASRVEAHKCNLCSMTTRFPRYTNAEKLLDTRRGRCGEWADCFTLCCRALGFEARYVLDWTDHVWTEVYSNSLSRWLHCDPCENICDKPLLYESGWGKKLTYVIAVSKDEVQDVTWRYSTKHEELLRRRTLCRESWLCRFIHSMWRQQLTALPQERQRDLWLRLLCELTEFISIKADVENLPGRSTGSLAWRQARGELGSSGGSQSVADINNSADVGFVFTATESERQSELIHVVYNCSTDKYIRKSSGNQEHKSWETCVFYHNKIFRKEESDWKMAYLARSENSSAQISWKFDLGDTDLRIGKVEIKAQSTVFENGKVSWRICAGDNCFKQSGDSLQECLVFDAKGSKSMTIVAALEGGNGDNAWQHAQLFRQGLDDKEATPFEMKLLLN